MQTFAIDVLIFQTLSGACTGWVDCPLCVSRDDFANCSTLLQWVLILLCDTREWATLSPWARWGSPQIHKHKFSKNKIPHGQQGAITSAVTPVVNILIFLHFLLLSHSIGRFIYTCLFCILVGVLPHSCYTFQFSYDVAGYQLSWWVQSPLGSLQDAIPEGGNFFQLPKLLDWDW
jgi:hypothetical protein